MSPRQIVFANALAAAIAAAFYSIALVLFAVVDSSEFGRIERAGLQFELAYFVLYFIYFGLYLGFAIALTKQAGVAVRAALGMTAALAVVPLGWAAFMLGYMLGVLLFVFPGMLFMMGGGLQPALMMALVAVPITGLGMGYAFNVMLAVFANWQQFPAEVAEIRRRNIAAAALSACTAAYLAFAHGMGHAPALGLARVAEQIAVGLIGPLIHVASAAALAFKAPAGEVRAPLGRQATRAALAIGVCMVVVLSAAAWMAHVRSGYQLWSATALLRTLATPAAVQERRRPAPDRPIRIADYVVEARPGDLKGDSSYDWKTERFLHAKFKLGTVKAADGPVEVMLDLTKAWQTGLGYICNEPVEGALSPCQVVHRKKNVQDDKNLLEDPRVIWVGLYQGESKIGRVGRTFLMSCRYSTRICKLEFVQPWYKGLRVALIFDRSKREHWAEIVRFAIPEIERVIRRAP